MYFKQGNCAKGQNCPFRHDVTTVPAANPKTFPKPLFAKPFIPNLKFVAEPSKEV